MDPNTISDILGWVLELEDRGLTGKVVNLGDGAGITRFGITSRDAGYFHGDFFTYPKAAAIEAAKVFYFNRYWKPLGIYMNLQLTAPYAATALSCAVNCGVGVARSLDEISRGSLSEFIELWQNHYRQIVSAHPDRARFLDGWLSRSSAIFPELPK